MKRLEIQNKQKLLELSSKLKESLEVAEELNNDPEARKVAIETNRLKR